MVQRSRFNFLQSAQLWFHKRPDQPVISDEFENVITLSNEFYQEVASHPIPTDLNAVKVLASSPAVLDLFMWLSYRCFAAKSQDTIPIFGPLGLASQLGNVEYSRPRKFREKLETWLDLIRTMWPECPAEISKCGERLVVSPAAALTFKGK